MENMEEKLESILNDPRMMQQIMSLAQTLGQQQEATQTTQPQKNQESSGLSLPEIDPSMIKSLSALAGQGTIDTNQRTLLKALSPYLSQNRIGKLEKAMRAARMARIASSFMNQGGLSFLTGR